MPNNTPQHRRSFLGQASLGMGSIALAGLLQPKLLAAGGERPGVDQRLLESLGVVKPLHHVAKAKRVIFLCMAGGPSHLETFDDKPELARARRQADARVVHRRPADRAAPGQGAAVLGPAGHVRQPRPERPARSASFLPHIAKIADEHLHHPLDAHRADQPRPGPHLHEHRHQHLGPAEHGLVDQLRPGERVRRPARLRRADQPRRPQPAADLLAAVAQRLPAEPLPGRAVPLHRRPGPLRQATPPASTIGGSTTWSTRSAS